MPDPIAGMAFAARSEAPPQFAAVSRTRTLRIDFRFSSGGRGDRGVVNQLEGIEI
jgi:hypothetical protein